MSKAVDLVKNKPVATTGTIAVLAAGIEGYAETRGWIPAPVIPYALGGTIAILSFIAHQLVSPYEKVKGIVEEGLHLTDADFGRGEVIVEHLILPALEAKLGVKPSTTIAAHAAEPDPVPVIVTSAVSDPVPDSRSAGAPVDPAAG